MKTANFKIIFSYKRLWYLLSSICIMFIILIIKLIDLHIWSADRLIKEGDNRTLRIQNTPKARGIITDRMGRLLAINISVDSVCIDPKIINKFGGIYTNIDSWRKLSKILNFSLEKLILFVNNHNTERFIYLSRQIDPIISQYINQLKIPGVYIQRASKRYYPSGSVTAHLVGITDIDNQGIEGIEKSFNSCLSSNSTVKVIRKDRLGRIIDNINTLEHGRNAQDIVLSIDERLQYLAYCKLNESISINNAESGSIVLIDIYTGEILTMVNSPSYDPNNFSIFDKSVMRNRAITDIFEPGSTIKPIVVITALKNKIIHKNTVLDTSPYIVNGHQIKDVSYHDKLSISEILQKSSNVGVSKLALAMPLSVLINAYISFGIGESTNIGLIGENKGKIHACHRYSSDIEKAALSYGYGLMVTPLQLAKIYAIIGGMGIIKPISIIKVPDSVAKTTEESCFFSKKLMRTVINMMEITTLYNNGHDQSAKIQGYRMAIKTGTIKQVGSHGKYINKYIACTAGIAPSSNPRFALVVMINDPKNGYYYGGSVSSPVFKSFMNDVLKVMNIYPDIIE